MLGCVGWPAVGIIWGFETAGSPHFTLLNDNLFCHGCHIWLYRLQTTDSKRNFSFYMDFEVNGTSPSCVHFGCLVCSQQSPWAVRKIGMWQWQHVISFLHLLSASFPFLPVLERWSLPLQSLWISLEEAIHSRRVPRQDWATWAGQSPHLTLVSYMTLSLFSHSVSWQKKNKMWACCWQLCLLVWQK